MSKKSKQPAAPVRRSWDARILDWAFGPQPIARLEAIRILAPLAVLCFMSSRIVHVEDWISTQGFHVPDLLHDDYRQPLYVAPLPLWAAWGVAGLLVASGLATVAGAFTRISSAMFTATLFYVSVADRLAAFTVSKLGTLIALGLFLSPCGARWSVDEWRRRRKNPDLPRPDRVSGGGVRFFQLLLPVFYCASGICKARGDWLSNPAVIWSHVHDSYQTIFAYVFALLTPKWGWTIFQGATLLFETLAPIWFALRWTRPYALAFGLTMHFMIGIMFGPVVWFSLLMMSLLFASYAPEAWLARAFRGFRPSRPALPSAS